VVCILVIDDDELVRTTLSRTLTAAGYEVIEACNGDVGLRKFQGGNVDLVITDILMPEKEGLQTIQELREADGNMRIIAISGGDRLGNKSYLGMAVALGADDALAKPYRRQELLAKIDAVLNA
jgi:DNA-binding response OmpR family regulator